ncbi:hypothetical protein BC829DRAFT_437825 [Chytridium lagenaria]|nr:hypothetical protein BC829DRAFT_437825 [Chytridium lagenaria]
MTPNLKKMKRTKLTKIILGTCALVILVVAVISFGILNFRMALRKGSALKTTYSDTTFPDAAINDKLSQSALFSELCRSKSFIGITMSPSQVDPLTSKLKLRLNFQPCGDFISPDFIDDNNFLLSTSLTIVVDTAQYKFQAEQPMGSTEITVTFSSGDLNSYPFEQYATSDLYISGTFNNPRTNDSKSVLPLQLNVTGYLLTYEIDAPWFKTFQKKPEPSFMIMTIMWVLSLLSISLSVTLWSRGRKMEPPTLGFTIAMLFALPAIRNTQPGAPPIGATSDVASFFWAIILTSLSACLLFINYIVKYQKEKAA